MVPVFRKDGERCVTKNYHLVSLLSFFSKVFEKLVNNRVADHLEECDLFSNLQYNSQYQSTENQLYLMELLSLLLGLGL